MAPSMDAFYNMLNENDLKISKHQQEGLKWMMEREETPIPHNNTISYGGILAYDMGLGKTIITLGLILCNFKEKTLIVVPAIILEQWADVIYKLTKIKPIIWYKDKKIDELNTSSIILTTYHQLLQKTRKKRQNILLTVDWDRIIFDEAHHLKNKNTKIHTLACSIKSPTKWLLTGTPIQNNIKNLHNLFYIINSKLIDFCLPGKGRRTPIRNSMFHDLIYNNILALEKQETDITLPNLTINKMIVPWRNNKEINAYKSIKETTETCKIVSFIKERQCCVDNSKQYAILQQITKRINNNRPKIVFCHFIHEIMKFQILLETAFPNKTICVLTGKTTRKEKLDYLNVGKNDKHIDILIIQIQTGNEGLNLQYFKEMYFSSPHWNPCIEKQAIGRIYRINQTDHIDVS